MSGFLSESGFDSDLRTLLPELRISGTVVAFRSPSSRRRTSSAAELKMYRAGSVGEGSRFPDGVTWAGTGSEAGRHRGSGREHSSFQMMRDNDSPNAPSA